jgi:hypothetical protein
MKNFAGTLKKKANQLADDLNHRQWDTSVPAITRREIALTLNQMDRAEGLHEKQLRRLLRVECYVDTELMRMKERMPRYSLYWFPEKEKLHKRLFEIERERQNATLRLEERLRPLEDRLLGLVNRHEQLDV